MDALSFLNEFDRMCKTCTGCYGCPLQSREHCTIDELGDSEERNNVIQIVEQWSKEHPQKTRLQDFWEKYPNAPKDADGTPKTCCENLGYCKDCDESGGDCKKCWNMPIEEE